MKFTKEDARRRVLNCAKQYQQKGSKVEGTGTIREFMR